MTLLKNKVTIVTGESSKKGVNHKYLLSKKLETINPTQVLNLSDINHFQQSNYSFNFY